MTKYTTGGEVKASDVLITSEITPDNTIAFSAGHRTLLVLDEEGFVYKGNRIEDAGEAHRTFLEVLWQMKETDNDN